MPQEALKNGASIFNSKNNNEDNLINTTTKIPTVFHRFKINNNVKRQRLHQQQQQHISDLHKAQAKCRQQQQRLLTQSTYLSSFHHLLYPFKNITTNSQLINFIAWCLILLTTASLINCVYCDDESSLLSVHNQRGPEEVTTSTGKFSNFY